MRSPDRPARNVVAIPTELPGHFLKEKDHIKSIDFNDRITVELFEINSFERHRLDCSESGYGKMAGFCERVDE